MKIWFKLEGRGQIGADLLPNNVRCFQFLQIIDPRKRWGALSTPIDSHGLGKQCISREFIRQMKTLKDTTLGLPDAKRREMAHIVELIRTGFASAVARRSKPELRSGKLLKIILFGPYARGDWVEDPVGRYFSDFDILVVVNHEDLTDVAEFWSKVEARLLADLTEGKYLRTQASLLYHSIDDVNERLRLGRYFFTDIVRDGVVLHEEDGYPFAEPRQLTAGEALQESRDYFEEWFESANTFLKASGLVLEMGRPKEAAFQLHQAAERFYHCIFLVRTLHSPKTHNLNRLRSLSEQLEPCLSSTLYVSDQVQVQNMLLLAMWSRA